MVRVLNILKGVGVGMEKEIELDLRSDGCTDDVESYDDSHCGMNRGLDGPIGDRSDQGK